MGSVTIRTVKNSSVFRAETKELSFLQRSAKVHEPAEAKQDSVLTVKEQRDLNMLTTDMGMSLGND